MSSPFDNLAPLEPIFRPGYVYPENPLSYGGRWTTIIPGLFIDVAHELGTAGNPPGVDYTALVLSLWNPQRFTDFAISAQVHSLDAIVMRGRATLDGSTDYYEAAYNYPLGDGWRLRKKIGASTTSLAHDASGPGFTVFTGGPDPPDKYGFYIHGDTLESWQYDGATDAWTQILSASDSDLTDGFFVLGLTGASSLLFNYGSNGGIRGGEHPPIASVLAGSFRSA